MLKRAAGIAIGLFAAWVVIQAIKNDPQGSANKVGSAAEGVGDTGSSFATFFTNLSGPALLILVIVGVALYLANKKK